MYPRIKSELPDYVQDAFKEHKCAIGRFAKETFVYIPSFIGDKVGILTMTEIIQQTFPKELLERYDWRVVDMGDHYFFDLPGTRSTGKSSDVDLPDKLVECIQDLAKK